MRPTLARIAVVGVATILMPCISGVAAPAPPANIPVTPLNPPTLRYSNPWLSVDSTHPSHVAVAHAENQKSQTCFLALSTDGGATWRDQAVVGAGAPHPLPTIGSENGSSCQHPEVAFTPAGGLVYAFNETACCQGFTPGKSGIGFLYGHIYAMASSDVDQQLSAPVDVDAAQASQPGYPVQPLYDYQTNLVVDPTTGPGPARVYFAFDSFRLGDYVTAAAKVAVSEDGGRTFRPPVPFTTTRDSPGGLMGVTVDPAGALSVAFFDYIGTTYGYTPSTFDVDVVSSHDHGRTFTVPVHIATLPSPCNYTGYYASYESTVPNSGGPFSTQACPDKYPTLSAATGTTGGQLYVSWGNNARNPACRQTDTCDLPPARVSVAGSKDGGATWSQPVAIAAISDANQDILPQVRVAPTGRVDVAYYDLQPSGIEDTYLVSSIDAGTHFSAPRRISTASSYVRYPASGYYGTTFGDGYLDYLGIVATVAGDMVAWTDSRRGNSGTAHQDVYFAVAGDTDAAVVGLAGETAARAPNTAADRAFTGGSILAVSLLVLWVRCRRRECLPAAARAVPMVRP